MRFGEYLKQLRKAKGMTLVELAEGSGFSHSYLSQIETGKKRCTNVSPEVIRGLSDALGVTHIGMMIKAGYLTEEEVLIYRRESGINDLKGGEDVVTGDQGESGSGD
ncbi:helix-turn-helix domain-containing protein [Paenibacillus lautus]|uniref:helix-turn-helix domain-containing protein n=1 Tax=Paenibacillus lautus TaxID=1401 RepID=UPI00384A7A24